MTVDYGYTFHFWHISRCICFYHSSFYKKVFQRFVLPDVLSASFSFIQLLEVVLSVVHFCTALTETLNMILSCKSQFAFFMTYDIYIECIHIYSYILVCEDWYFFTYLSMFFNISRCIFKCKFIVYQVFVQLFLTWCIIFFQISFYVSLTSTVCAFDTSCRWWS